MHHTCTHTTHTCTHTYTHAHTHIHTCTHIYTHANILHTCILHTCTHIKLYTPSTHIYTVHTHNMHTHMYTNTCTQQIHTQMHKTLLALSSNDSSSLVQLIVQHQAQSTLHSPPIMYLISKFMAPGLMQKVYAITTKTLSAYNVWFLCTCMCYMYSVCF